MASSGSNFTACSDAGGAFRRWQALLGLLLCLVAFGLAGLTGLARPVQDPERPDLNQLDLNRATVAELQRLPGIGPVLAGRIVEHRRKHGPFKRPPEIIAVRGLSARKYRQIAHLLTIK